MSQATPEELIAIAASMASLRRSPDATVQYEALSDGLVWSDEVPRSGIKKASDLRPFRFLLRYRTSVILGIPDERYKEYWFMAQKLFPEWPGFHAERQSPALRSTYQELRAVFMAKLEHLPSRMPTGGN